VAAGTTRRGSASLPPDLVEREESLSLVHLVLLERLGPVERAAFVLHDALDWSHGDIARALGKSEAACRQILTRARRRLSEPPVATPARNAHTIELGRRFVNALGRGDIPTLMQALDASAVFLSDGGGRVLAALRPIRGPERICRLLSGLFAKRHEPSTKKEVTVNGDPGLWLGHPDGRTHAVYGLGFRRTASEWPRSTSCSTLTRCACRVPEHECAASKVTNAEWHSCQRRGEKLWGGVDHSPDRAEPMRSCWAQTSMERLDSYILRTERNDEFR
jgi:hypothetical protein